MIDINEFFNKFMDGQIIKLLPNYDDSGNRLDDVVETSSMFIRGGKKEGKLYYDHLAEPIFTNTEFRIRFGSKITERYFSYALVNGEYRLLSYGKVLYRLINNMKVNNIDVFDTTQDHVLNIKVSTTNPRIPDYSDSRFIISKQELIYKDKDLLQDPDKLKEYLMWNRPISIIKLIEDNCILRFPDAFHYLTDTQEMKEYLTPIFRKHRISNLNL